MAPNRTADQLVVIVGPTASGKSELAIKLARAFNGEIISADSRTIYKGLDIGTAKPAMKERSGIVHHGFDLVEPDEAFSAARFQKMAKNWIVDIQSRGKLPIMVGGTGLYIDSVIFDYEFGAPANIELRSQLEKLNIEELWDYCKNNNIELPENKINKRYVIRAIELKGINKRRKKTIQQHTFIIGINPDKKILQRRIDARVEKIIANSVVEEATKAAKRYSWQAPALNGNIYPIVHRIIQGQLTTQEAIEEAKTKDWRLAKRQLTWLKRNPAIHWHSSINQAYQAVEEYLSNFYTDLLQ
ncbi:MAG TPA: tRNA (adenosine(37)-N6)-dimethylallyltransferase MiaA [Candidatus Saccharimonadales bacterium]